MSRIKLAFIIPSLQPGGMERVMAVLLKFFAAKPSLDLHLVLYGIKRDIFYEIPNNITIHRPEFTFDNRKRLLHTLYTLRFLRCKMKELNAYSILSFGEYWNNFVLLSSLGLRQKIIVSDRSQPDKSLGCLHEKLRRWLYPKAYGVIAQTQYARQVYWEKFSHSNIVVIGNPIRQMKPNLALQRENIVLSVGRLIHTKHFDRLIRLFAELNQPGWRLIIVGGDALRQRNKAPLEKLVSELGVKDRIELLGSQSDVNSYYLRSKIFAFTSSSEGFPNVIGEAMSAGLPVVSYDCVAGPSEMIRDGHSGYLISPFDDDSFGTKLEDLMTDESKRLAFARAAQEDIRLFSAEQIGEKFFTLLMGDEASSN